jgi:stress-induced morphogen
MISIEDLVGLVTSKISDAEVNVMDKTGMKDHFIIHVTSNIFKDMDLMARHRAVQEILTPAMQDGRIHAAEIKTAIPD